MIFSKFDVDLPGKSGGLGFIANIYRNSNGSPFGSDRGSIVGTASVQGMNTETPWLHTVFVHPDFRNQGHGKHLIWFCLTEIKKTGKTRTVLWIDEENVAAQKFYERLGFFVTGEPASNQRPMMIRLDQ